MTTSAPVGNVSTLLNFVGSKGLTQTGGTNQTGGFGDVMNKTQSSMTNGSSQDQAKAPVRSGDASGVRVSDDGTRKISQTEAVSQKTASSAVTEGQKDAVEEAGGELVKDIAKELGVSEEDVLNAMAELGLSMASLFDQANLTQLVLEVTGEPDMTALLTEESLFTQLQNVIGLAKDIRSELADDLGVSEEDIRAMLDTLTAQEAADQGKASPKDGLTEPAPAEENAGQKAPEIVVEVKSAGETVKMTADENGNVTGTLEKVPQQTEEKSEQPSDAKQHAGNEEKGMEQHHTQNNFLDTMLQGRSEVSAAEETPQMANAFSSQTMDIMNQIMDYMKIQLKPGMDQLQMQLHPESLGTVHIQLTSKAGEVTAQFQVQNEEVKAVLESQIVELKESLKEQGVKVEAVQVTVENRGFESNLWQGQGKDEDASSQHGRKAQRRIDLRELDALSMEESEEISSEDALRAKIMEANGNTVDYTV